MKMCNLIGPQVRKLREEKGWTQRTLSEKLQVAGLDISRSSLAKVESRLHCRNHFCNGGKEGRR